MTANYQLTAGARREAGLIVTAAARLELRDAELTERMGRLIYRMLVECETNAQRTEARKTFYAMADDFRRSDATLKKLASSATQLIMAEVHPSNWHTVDCACKVGEIEEVEFPGGTLRLDLAGMVAGCIGMNKLWETYVSTPKPTKPAEPAEPAEPAKPAEPAEPAKPAKPAKPAEPATPATVETAHRTPAELVMLAMAALARADKLISAGAEVPVQELAALSHNYGHLVATVKASRTRVA